ncbi:hypothetical protein CAPTEDRAFT_190656 [Capitella teleta]|uniref:Uncharacterized protein n=1 Tax=Capitella teleta TaxID=283909 RepID=R7T6C4_CAPTE|nr:hypothetical protein CAPTEDRAFT_190656 [Capitella teleta]|eukprot:ELT88843.1 hypothetical protein CAPTEDRAFT_190656 [Capitella teleta]
MANATENAANLETSVCCASLFSLTFLLGIPLNIAVWVKLPKHSPLAPLVVLATIACATIPPLSILDLSFIHQPSFFNNWPRNEIRSAQLLITCGLQSSTWVMSVNHILRMAVDFESYPLKNVIPWVLCLLYPCIQACLAFFGMPHKASSEASYYFSDAPHDVTLSRTMRSFLELALVVVSSVSLTACSQSQSPAPSHFEIFAINKVLSRSNSKKSLEVDRPGSVVINERSLQKVVQVLGDEIRENEQPTLEGRAFRQSKSSLVGYLTTLEEEEGDGIMTNESDQLGCHDTTCMKNGVSIHSSISSISEASFARSVPDPLTKHQDVRPSFQSDNQRFRKSDVSHRSCISRKQSCRNSRRVSFIRTATVVVPPNDLARVHADNADDSGVLPEAWGKTSGNLMPAMLNTNHPFFVDNLPPSVQDKILWWRTSESSAAITVSEDDVPIDEGAFLNLCLNEDEPKCPISVSSYNNPEPVKQFDHPHTPKVDPASNPEIRVIRPSGSSLGGSFLRRILHRKIGVFTPLSETSDEVKYTPSSAKCSRQDSARNPPRVMTSHPEKQRANPCMAHKDLRFRRHTVVRNAGIVVACFLFHLIPASLSVAMVMNSIATKQNVVYWLLILRSFASLWYAIVGNLHYTCVHLSQFE